MGINGEAAGVSRGQDLREMLDWAITQSPLNIALFDTQLRHVRLNSAMHKQLGLSTETAGRAAPDGHV